MIRLGRQFLGLVALFLAGHLCLFAVQKGESKEALLQELGSPQSEMSAGNRAILTFANGGRAVLMNDHVVEYSIERIPTTKPPSEHLVLKVGKQNSIDLGKFSWKKILVSACVALLAGFISFPFFFSGLSDLIESERYNLQPNWISWMRGEYWEDVSSTAKLKVWTAVILGSGVFTYIILKAFDFFID